MKKDIAILGVGNILEMDDGVAIYATRYLEMNYSFKPHIDIINGGVEGINLLNLFMGYHYILVLDAIDIDDEAGSIYHIPSKRLTGYGLNSGGAHEIGVLQCFDILELMGRELPKSTILGIIPKEIDISISLSDTISNRFDEYISTLVEIIKKEGIEVTKNRDIVELDTIIDGFREPHMATTPQVF